MILWYSFITELHVSQFTVTWVINVLQIDDPINRGLHVMFKSKIWLNFVTFENPNHHVFINEDCSNRKCNLLFISVHWEHTHNSCLCIHTDLNYKIKLDVMKPRGKLKVAVPSCIKAWNKTTYIYSSPVSNFMITLHILNLCSTLFFMLWVEINEMKWNETRASQESKNYLIGTRWLCVRGNQVSM